jgi:hypothetical protein
VTRTILGPFRPLPIDGVRFDDLGDAVRLTATRDLVGIGTGRFAEPGVHASIAVGELLDPELLGFAFTQFAMPVRAVAGRPFDFAPAANLRSPPVVIPLVIRDSSGRVCLLAPLDAWHEQVIAVSQDDTGVSGLRWGWHGDLDRVPAGFSTTLGVYEGASVAEVFDRWGGGVRRAAGTTRPGRDADPLLARLSYWTDNGAAYWYRTEPGRDLPTTLADKLAELETLGVGVGSVELDSWFYPHEISRPVTEVGYPEAVPPTGMLEWAPRADVLPDGVVGLADRLGHPPLVLHSRHISPASPYLDDGEWWVDFAAHPVDQDFFRRWFADAAGWGATCIEQDWMMVTWFGVRQLREVPGRATEWQRALDRAAADHGMTLLWCMATPADLVASVELRNVVAVRTSDDYRFADDPATLWHWYLTVNRLADALALATFKDCFFTAVGDGIDGDPHPEVEALLSAMSAGPVGIGDRIGRTDVDVVRRVARPDGLLVTSDRPAALADQSFFRPASDASGLCWATAASGDWIYVVVLHTAGVDTTITDRFALDRELLVYDWRSETADRATSIEVELAPRDWALFVCCPIEIDPGGAPRSLVGDPTKYATMSAARVRRSDDRAELLLADGEAGGVLRWWTEEDGLFDIRQPAPR